MRGICQCHQSHHSVICSEFRIGPISILWWLVVTRDWCLITRGKTWKHLDLLQVLYSWWVCVCSFHILPEKRNHLAFLCTVNQNLYLCWFVPLFCFTFLWLCLLFLFCYHQIICSPTALAQRTWWKWTYKKNISGCTLHCRGNGHWH